MNDIALHLSGVTVRHGRDIVLREVELEVRDGERFVLVGASGAGKTTLLRAVAGFAEQVEGRIDIAGRDVSMMAPEKRNAVYMHQAPVLFPHLDVFENVAFPLRVRRTPASEIAARVGRSLDAMRLTGFAARLPRTLSGGQRHRVALARAIVARPDLLLLDEPFAGLDPALKSEIREALLEAHGQYGPGFVLVTHDFADAALIADRIGVLIGGRLVQVATPAEVFARPASLSVARFLCVANEIPGHADGAGCFHSPLGTLDGVCEGLPSGPAVGVFRPAGVLIGCSDGSRARVTGIRVRPDHTTMMMSTAVGPIEAALSLRLGTPSIGDELTISLDPRQVVVFSLQR